MKKIAALLSLSLLAACTYANGNINFLPIRNKIFEVFQTEKIFYYDAADAEYLSESETVYENDFEFRQPLTASKGDVIAAGSLNRIDYYTTEVLKVTENATMSSSYTPVILKKDATYKAFGEVKLDGVRYMLATHGKDKDILLVAGNGEIYHRIGRIVNGRLAVLETTFFVEPETARMIPVVKTRTETVETNERYELVFNGIKNGQLSLTYIPCEPGAQPQEFLFPQTQETLEINDIKLEIISLREDKISYMLL